MPSVVITGHGGRGIGTSRGSYLVPKGVTIYFFVNDEQVLYAGASDKIMSFLCTKHPSEIDVRKIATDVRSEYQTCPNYICYGTNDFKDPSGVYLVGKSAKGGPVLSIPDGTEKRLSEIIGGSGGGVIASSVYWLCCRAAPDNSNNIDDNKDVISGQFKVGKKLFQVGATEQGGDTGISPSQVKLSGKWR